MPSKGTMFNPPVSSRSWRAVTQAAISLPLPFVQMLLTSVASRIARSRPDLFARMGMHARKAFLIDPVDLPIVFRMVPDTTAPALTVHARHACPQHDGAIRGRFLHLLDMIDGSLDGDALFFNRDLVVTGDVEAVVTLRNALDDFDGDIVREILRGLGPLAPFGGAALSILRTFDKTRGQQHG